MDGSDEPDLTKELVLVIPANARVAISSAAMADDDEDLQSGAGGNDMRHDVIWWAHNAKVPHARQHDSVVRAASVGWWPAQEVEVKYHYRYCSVCTSLRLALRHVGMGVGAQKPFSVVQMDDAPLSEKLRELPGVTYTFVLVFCCVASGKVTYVLCFDVEHDATQVELGMVLECGDDAVQLQMLLHRKCKTRFTWLPVWQTAAGVKGCTDQPMNSEPVDAFVLHDRILGKVTLTSGYL